MNTATNMAITTMNTQIAMQAAVDADGATAERCNIELMTYQPQAASVQQMQSYAGCVERLYPEHTEADIFGWKIMIAFALVSALIGAVIGVRSANPPNYKGWVDKLMLGLGGLFFGAVLAGILLGIIGLISFIFS